MCLEKLESMVTVWEGFIGEERFEDWIGKE